MVYENGDVRAFLPGVDLSEQCKSNYLCSIHASAGFSPAIRLNAGGRFLL